MTGASYGLERQLDDGTWSTCVGGLHLPGRRLSGRAWPDPPQAARIPPDAAPGAYRLLDAGIAAPFTVTP